MCPGPGPSPWRGWRAWALLFGFAAADFGLTHLGLALTPAPSTFAVFWPAAGLGVGALLLTSRRHWPAVLAAAAIPIAVFNAAMGSPPSLVAAFALGNVCEPLLAASLALWLCRGRPQLSSPAHLLALLVSGPLLASGIAALPGVLALAWIPHAPLLDTWFRIWMGSALGILAVTPVLLAWGEPQAAREAGRRSVLEAVAVAIAAGLGSALVFFWPPGRIHLDGALLVPIVLWAALRFGPRGATTTALALALAALAGTVSGHGTFAVHAGSAGDAARSAQLFAAVTVFSFLAMNAVVESRRLAAEALQRSQHDLRLVHMATDAATDFVVCVEPDGTVVYANDAYCAAVGRDRARVLGTPIWSAWWSAGPEEWASHWQEVDRRGALTIEKLATLPGDEALPVEIRSSRVSFEGRAICVSTGRGLRERRQVEAALRMASVGTLAAGMAHEINNPLAYVLANLDWVSQRVTAARGALAEPATEAREELEEVLPVLGEITDGAERIRSIVRDLRLFSRGAERGTGPASADVGRTVRAALSLASVEIRHRAQLVLALEDGLPKVAGDEHRLGQVFLNLLVNSAQAMPEGETHANLIRVGTRLGEPGEVLVEVEDTGAGMTPSVLAHVFEPFFTTKRPGAGTGLGLSICHGIVAEVGGRIEVSSRPGAGTLFRVRLRVAPEPDERTPTPAVPSPAITPRGRILLVDDDPLVATAAARLLRDHEVQTCHAAADALRRCALEPFDLVICDLLMPEMTGMDFQRRLRLEQPELAARIIFVTGGAFTPEASAFLATTPNPHLAKPFDAATLRAEVARALASAPHPVPAVS